MVSLVLLVALVALQHLIVLRSNPKFKTVNFHAYYQRVVPNTLVTTPRPASYRYADFRVLLFVHFVNEFTSDCARNKFNK